MSLLDGQTAQALGAGSGTVTPIASIEAGHPAPGHDHYRAAEAGRRRRHRRRPATPVARLGRPEDVADACVFLASPLPSRISGHDLVVEGGVTTRSTP